MNKTVLTQYDVRVMAKYYITKHGSSVAFIAKNVGITRSNLSLWLNGHSNLREKNLIKVIEFCK